MGRAKNLSDLASLVTAVDVLLPKTTSLLESMAAAVLSLLRGLRLMLVRRSLRTTSPVEFLSSRGEGALVRKTKIEEEGAVARRTEG